MQNYSKFMSLYFTNREWWKALLMAVLGAVYGYFAEIYNDLDLSSWQALSNFDFIQAATDAAQDWRSIVNKIIFAVGVYLTATIFRNSQGKYFTREKK